MATRFTRNLRDPHTGKFSGREIWLRVRGMLAVFVSLGVLGTGGYFAYDWISEKWTAFKTADDYESDGTGHEKVEINIPEGARGGQIGEILEDADVIKDASTFLQEFMRVEEDARDAVKFGRYSLPKQISARIALNMLMDPDQAYMVHNRVTLIEGLWLTNYAKTYAKATELPEKDFTNAFKDLKKLGLPDWALKGAQKAKTAEGLIFPDTYDIPEKPKALDMVKMATKRLDTIAKEIDLEAKAKTLGFTPYEIVTVASIIEREVNRDADRPKAAQVIYNRLKSGQRLEMDSTVAYAVGKTGVIATTKEDRANKSPYNTYLHKGLPPGPIGAPGRKALEAALNPEKGDWLFWVVINGSTGETQFSSTLAEHNEGVAKYQAWCQETDANYKVCFGRDR